MNIWSLVSLDLKLKFSIDILNYLLAIKLSHDEKKKEKRKKWNSQLIHAYAGSKQKIL